MMDILEVDKRKPPLNFEECMPPKSLTSFLLAEAAEIETRLRSHCLQLLEPTVRKQSVLERSLREIRVTVDGHVQEMVGLRQVVGMASQCMGTVDGFRAELAEWDDARRSQEQRIGHRLSTQETEIAGLRQLLDQKAGDWSAFRRSLKALGDQIFAAREETTELRRYCSQRMDQNREKVVKLRNDFELRIVAAETDINDLKDGHTVMSTAITHVGEELARMDGRVDESAVGIADLSRTKMSVECVEEYQRDANAFSRRMDTTVSSLKERFQNLVDDLKNHFETASEVVGASTALQIDALRAHFSEEVERASAARKEMQVFIAKQTEAVERLQTDVGEHRVATTHDLELFKEAHDMLSKAHVAEKKSVDVEVTQLRKTLREVDASLQGDSHSRSVRKDVLSILLETQLLSAALDRQDDVDKRSIALFGYKDNETKPTAADKTFQLPELSSNCKSRCASRGKKSNDNVVSPVVTIDKRCLSCSGSAATTLAGFKLACLQYSPSPVEYEQEIYGRSELINKRLGLLEQAKKQLKAVDK